MSVKEVLITAKSYIEQGFTQGCFARDINDRFVDWSSENAVCWCAEGALMKSCVGTGLYSASYSALRNVSYMSIPQFNDSHSKKEVLELYNKAIEKCD